MLKKNIAILGSIGCIFLIISLHWVFYTDGLLGLSMPLVLLGIVLAYIFFHAIKLFDNNEGHLERKFLLLLIVAIVLSSIILIDVFPYFASRFLHIS